MILKIDEQSYGKYKSISDILASSFILVYDFQGWESEKILIEIYPSKYVFSNGIAYEFC